MTMPAMIRFNHANRGIRLRVIPGHRMEMIVAIRLIAVPMLPNPETSKATVQ